MSPGHVIAGVELSVDAGAIVVTAESPLTVVSTAPVRGGFATARTIVNLHVSKDFPWEDLDERLATFAAARRLPPPWVGVLTAARTEAAERAVESSGGITAIVIATIGLSNLVAAGAVEPLGASAVQPSTINTIVVVDAAPEPAALVNAVATVTEVKVAVLGAFGLRCPDGTPATGTSTDAVVIAATGRGPHCRFGGPRSDLGAIVARATAHALERGVARWLEAHR